MTSETPEQRETLQPRPDTAFIEDEEMEKESGDGRKSQNIDEIDEIENTSCNCLKIMVMLIAIITLVCQDTLLLLIN